MKMVLIRQDQVFNGVHRHCHCVELSTTGPAHLPIMKAVGSLHFNKKGVKLWQSCNFHCDSLEN